MTTTTASPTITALVGSLTARQRQILLAVEPMKSVRCKNGFMLRGDFVALGTVETLERKRLIRVEPIYGIDRLRLTHTGRMVVGILEERRRRQVEAPSLSPEDRP